MINSMRNASTMNANVVLMVDSMVTTSACIVDETTIPIIAINMEAVATLATITTTTTTTDGTPISVVDVLDMEMVMATVIVCLLFNLMMNVEFTVDTSGTSVISTHDRILIPQGMAAVVVVVVMEYTDQQDSSMLFRMVNTILPKP
jgi:hypothetical protein